MTRKLSPVAVNPHTKRLEVLCTGVFGDPSERANTNAVMKWNCHASFLNVGAIGMLPLQNSVVTRRPYLLEVTAVDEHFCYLIPTELARDHACRYVNNPTLLRSPDGFAR